MPRSTAITGDAKQVKALIEWARSAGVELSEVSVGTCRVTVGPTRSAARPQAPVNDRETIYRQFGGEAFAEMAVDGGELQPVVRSR